jgi:hypothetical protein
MAEAIAKKTLSAGAALGTAGYFKSGDEVFIGLCRWAYTMSWYAGSPIPIPAFRTWIKRLGFSEEHVTTILIPSVLDRSNPDLLFAHQEALFNFANFTISKLDQAPSGDLLARISNEMMYDGVSVHLGRIKMFKRFKGWPFRLVLGVYAATMLISLLALVSTGPGWHSLPVLGTTILGAILSIFATTWYVVELARHG